MSSVWDRIEQEAEKPTEEPEPFSGTRSLDAPFLLLIFFTAAYVFYLFGIRLGGQLLAGILIGILIAVFGYLMLAYKPVFLADDLSKLYPDYQWYIGNKWGEPFIEDGRVVIRVSLLPPRYIVFAHGGYERPYVIKTPFYDFLLGRVVKILEYGRFLWMRYIKRVLFVPMIPEGVSYVELKVHKAVETEEGYAKGEFIETGQDFPFLHSLAKRARYIFIAPADVNPETKEIVFTGDPMIAEARVASRPLDATRLYSTSSLVSRLLAYMAEMNERATRKMAELLEMIRSMGSRSIEVVGLFADMLVESIKDIRIRESTKVALETMLEKIQTALMTTESKEVIKEVASAHLQRFYDRLLGVEKEEVKEHGEGSQR